MKNNAKHRQTIFFMSIIFLLLILFPFITQSEQGVPHKISWGPRKIEDFVGQEDFMGVKKDIKIAIYNGRGAIPLCYLATKLTTYSLGYKSDYINKEQIIKGLLKNYNILIMPGGNAHEQFLGLDGVYKKDHTLIRYKKNGISQIKKWVKEGGDYIGICAGAYLAWEKPILPKDYPTPEQNIALGIGDINIINIMDITKDMKKWNEIDYIKTSDGLKAVIFPSKWFINYEISFSGIKIPVLYAGGPLFGQDDKIMATYTGKIYGDFPYPAEFRKNMLKGSGAMVTNIYGNGEVFLFSFHPEFTLETWVLLKLAIEWVSAK